MHDKAHVRFVDAHPKRDRGHDDLHVVAQKRALILRALLVGKSGVIRLRGEPVAFQRARQLVHLPAREAINNAGLLRMLLQELQRLAERIFLGHNAEHKVLAIEAGNELLRGREVERRANILAHAQCRRGREREAHGLGKARAAGHNLPILRTKIMAPFRNAMRLINREAIDVERRKQCERFRFQQSLGRDIEQLHFAATHALAVVLIFFGRERAIQKHRGHAELLQLRHLILHQGNERRNHDGQALKEQRRKLIAQRFAAAPWA